MNTTKKLIKHITKVALKAAIEDYERGQSFLKAYIILDKGLIMAGKGNAQSGSTQAKDMGSKGGKSGGPARAKKLTTQQRSEIARKGAVAKNAKHKK